MVVIRFRSNERTQQPLHGFKVAHFFGHKRLVVEELVVFGLALDGGAEQFVRLHQFSVLAQQLHLRHQPCALVGGCCRWPGLYQLASLLHAALPREELGTSGRNNDSVARVLDPLQPLLGQGEVLALLGDLGKTEKCLSLGALLCIRGGIGSDLQVATQRHLRRLQAVLLELQESQGEPGRCVRGALLGQQLELMKGIRGPLRVQKHTGICHADFWCRILFQDASDQGFGKRLAGCHQLQRQQGRIFITRIDSHSFASRVKCTCSLAGHCTHPSNGDPGRSSGLFSIQVIGQGLLDDASRHLLVGHPHEPARNRGDDAGAIPQGCGSQF